MSVTKEIEELEGIQSEITELKSWQNRFRMNDKGKVIANSVFNVELILDNDLLLKDKLSFNEFSQESKITESIVMNGVMIPAGYIEDGFTHALTSYIEQTYYYVPSPANIDSAISNVAKRNAYHPIKDYLNQCEKDWDNQKRIAGILPKYLGVDTGEYTEKAFLCLLIGGIQKVFAPYEKFDFIFDFVGDTGTGKTSLIQKLFLDSKGLYTDSMKTFTQPDDFMIMQRAWCVNDDELVVSKRTGIEVIKKFASQKELEYRVPYARRSIRKPKNFVIVRTTNESGHLKDETGNRRFIPFNVKRDQQEVHPLSTGEDKLDASLISQLWGEAMHQYKEIDRKSFYVEVEKLADAELEAYTSIDSVKDIVYSVLEIPIPIDFYSYNDDQRASYIQGYVKNNSERHTIGTHPVHEDDLVQRDRVRVRDLSLEGFNKQYGESSKLDKRIRVIMDNHPEWEKSKRNGVRFGNHPATGYLRK